MDLESFGIGAITAGALLFFTGFLKKAGEEFFVWISRKIDPKSEQTTPSHLVIHMEGVSSGQTTDNQMLGSVGRVSTISFDEIMSGIDKAPPLQRTKLAESYVGLPVEWDTKFVDGTPIEKEGTVRIQLSAKKSAPHLGSVFCEVPFADNRELGILPEGSEIRVSGVIESISSSGVTLKNSRLDIYRHQ